MNQDKLRGEFVSRIIEMIRESDLEDSECLKCLLDCVAMWLFVGLWTGKNAESLKNIIVIRHASFKKAASEMGLSTGQFMDLL